MHAAGYACDTELIICQAAKLIVDGQNARWASGSAVEEKKNSVDVSRIQCDLYIASRLIRSS